ncbi:hypothetical protein ACP70R_003419 [Stipagrostis hirtigluma subsp. patula]
MPASVKVIEEARVAVPAAAALPAEPLRLSALDALWITFPLIQRVLIFADGDGDGGSAVPPFASVVAALRASLAETAARFPPLAGKVVHQPSTGDAAVDCTERGVAGGVRFLVAESDDADAARLGEDPDHDVEAFAVLVPVLHAGELPAETMAAQVTRLRGGVALGVAAHHAVVDGRSLWRFLQAWAAACRGEGEADAAAAPPAFDRAAVKLPGGEELARSVLRKYAPNLPVATVVGVLIRPNLSRRTFTFSAQQMGRLKQRIAGHTSPPPSSFVAVAAAAWVSFVRAKHPSIISPGDEVTLFFLADVRARLDPPPGDGYFGTCVTGCLARDLLLAEDDGAAVAAAAAAVQAEVRRAAEQPLAMWDWMELVGRVDLERVVNMTGSTRFPAYDASDFGWGPPSRTELVTMNHDGQVVLLAGKGGAGAVQASVSIHQAHMDAFKAHFLSYVS